MSPSKFQLKVLHRLKNGDRLKARVTFGSYSTMRIGLGIHRFESDKLAVKLDTLFALRDLGRIRTVRATIDKPYDEILLVETK